MRWRGNDVDFRREGDSVKKLRYFKVKFDYMKREQVKIAMKLFFNLDSNFFISGLTPGDFANVQKKADFMKITDEKEITKMLQQEVDLKKDKNLQRSIGF